MSMKKTFFKPPIGPKKKIVLSCRLGSIESSKRRTINKSVIPVQRILRSQIRRSPVRLPTLKRRKTKCLAIPCLLLKKGSAIQGPSSRLLDIRNFVASQVTPWGSTTRLERGFSATNSAGMYGERLMNNCMVYMMKSHQNITRRWPQENYKPSNHSQLSYTRHCYCHNCSSGYYRASSRRCPRCFTNDERTCWGPRIRNCNYCSICNESTSSDSISGYYRARKQRAHQSFNQRKGHDYENELLDGSSELLVQRKQQLWKDLPLLEYKDDKLHDCELCDKKSFNDVDKTASSCSSESLKEEPNGEKVEGLLNPGDIPVAGQEILDESSSNDGYQVTRKKSVQRFDYMASPSSVTENNRWKTRQSTSSVIKPGNSRVSKSSASRRRSTQIAPTSSPTPQSVKVSNARNSKISLKSAPHKKARQVPSRFTPLQSAMRQRLITNSNSPPSYENVNVKEFVNFLSSLSMNTIGTLTNKRKALKLFKKYLYNQRSQ